MPTFNNTLPLSFYIHLPWCVRKCPYCDFNSHELRDSLPEALYVAALMQELDQHLSLVQARPIQTIFFGGGTPSLFSAAMIEQIIDGIAKRTTLDKHVEITLEANPGAAEQARFRGFRLAGVNRLSLGLQSLQNDKLKRLGRIHDSDQAKQAITMAINAGFDNFNLDLMYGLPDQTIDDALNDLHMALAFEPSHLSWYQLTIEPNTVFYKHTPTLPEDESIWEMQLAGQDTLRTKGLLQYEVSAYAMPGKTCQHNRNYWEFGDYLGLGAGAHSKITLIDTGNVIRFAQVKQPRDYLDVTKRRVVRMATPDMSTHHCCSEQDLVFEFMLNALRLTNGVAVNLFTERTGLAIDRIQETLILAREKGFLHPDESRIRTTERGMRFLNDVVAMFL